MGTTMTQTTEQVTGPVPLSPESPKCEHRVIAVVGEKLTRPAFDQLCGQMSGYPFVKVLVDRRSQTMHFIANTAYEYHADYIAEQCLNTPSSEIRKRIDQFNERVYLSPNRDFYIGIVSLHRRNGEEFYALETVEIDNMDKPMLLDFYNTTRAHLDPATPLLFKPANHNQELMVAEISPTELPRVLNHELFASAPFIALNPGKAQGRLRLFPTERDYTTQFETIEWYDIIVMNRVPDNVPRVAGIINSHHTTPLSHTNVLAHGWHIPNSVEKGILNRFADKGMDKKWVEYTVDNTSDHAFITEIPKPDLAKLQPAWRTHVITLEEPETSLAEICSLEDLRLSDSFRYGTKAANLGELTHILNAGSSKITGYYRIPRPPRENLVPYLRKLINAQDGASIQTAAEKFLRDTIKIPRGIAIPFTLQRQFLEASPAIQQCIGKIKMALELNADVTDSLCVELQNMIRRARLSTEMRDYIDSQIAIHLGGATSFVVRSSSNAEDLEDFSAAGIYESINHVTTSENIFQSIKEVWASLVAPRSVRLRQQVGISLDRCYMGVIVQEEVQSDFGGVMVTTNPLNKADIRNVYINVSTKLVQSVVSGASLPIQYLYNTLEGGGQTLSLGDATEDLKASQKEAIQKLAIAGRLLQSHFSKDYTFSCPADIEWAIKGDNIYILQSRPYSG
jgi:hypothetical protein